MSDTARTTDTTAFFAGVSAKYSKQLINQLAFEEGIYLHMYPDPKDLRILTIGIGHNCSSIAKWQDGRQIANKLTLAEVAALLEEDLDRTVSNLTIRWPEFKSIPVGPRKDAIIAMAFQLGVAGLLKYVQMRHAAVLGNWQAAAVHARDSDWATQVPERAERVIKQLESGIYYTISKPRIVE